MKEGINEGRKQMPTDGEYLDHNTSRSYNLMAADPTRRHASLAKRELMRFLVLQTYVDCDEYKD